MYHRLGNIYILCFAVGWEKSCSKFDEFQSSRFAPRIFTVKQFTGVPSKVREWISCWIYIRVCDMSKTNVAISATNCSFTLGRQHVYDKFPETERRRFRMCLRQCLQFIFSANKNFFELKKNVLNFFEI